MNNRVTILVMQDVLSRAEAELARLMREFLQGAGAQFKEARTLAYSFYCRLRDITSKFASSPTVLNLFASPFQNTELTEGIFSENGQNKGDGISTCFLMVSKYISHTLQDIILI